ncbi:hypothetical protein LINGRAHAP2_LOCUS12954, partial [Linum grandiflorum]
PDRLCGPESHRPVILPLAGEGGDRCSVKPASRITLLSTETRPPRSSPRNPSPTPVLERAGQRSDTSSPTFEASPMSHHLNASTRITSSRYQARRDNIRVQSYLFNTILLCLGDVVFSLFEL